MRSLPKMMKSNIGNGLDAAQTVCTVKDKKLHY